MAVDGTKAVRHLKRVDPVLRAVIADVGPYSMPEPFGEPYRALARAIVFQQLSGKAAETIFQKFIAQFGTDGTFPRPPVVLSATPERLREAGLSRQKAAAILSLSAHFAGELASVKLDEMADEEVIERLLPVRGIGRWTAEMFLMFELQRPDVLPVNDLGLNRAMRRLYGLDALPVPAQVLEIGAAWRPWASVACWYLWRSEEVVMAGRATPVAT